VDDSFTLNPKRAIQICNKMRREKINMEWFCEGRVDNCSYELMRELSRAGCKAIFFGVESANQRILDYYNKKTSPHQSMKAITVARKAGIDLIIGSFILGAPDETREEIQNTVKFAQKLPIDFPRFNILGANPGTDLWEELKQRGVLNEEAYWETGVSVSKICPSAIPFQKIQKMIRFAYSHFMHRPSFIARQVGRLLKSPYRMRVLCSNLNRISDIREESAVLTLMD